MALRSRGLVRPRVLIPVIGLAAGLAAAAALAAGPGPVRVTDTGASVGCAVSYSVSSQWDTGFTAALTITNMGSPVTSWDLRYAYGGRQLLSQGWSGTWAQSGSSVTVRSESWNGALATGGSAQIGANFADSGTNTAPAAFTLNGTACTGSATASPAPPAATVPPTAPASPTVPAPAPTATAPAAPPASAGSAPQLQVNGNMLVNAQGQQVVLHGVDRPGTEFACVQNFGIFDGPSDQASITAMKSFGVNAVRIPLNEACWNGESYVSAAYAGSAYRSAIRNYVSLLNSDGMVAILDLHWTDGAYSGPSAACSSAQASCQKPMPDAAQAVPFWTSVASTFMGNDAVVFDLFNEPYPEQADNGDEAGAWLCWRNGGTSCAGIGYPVAGLQALVDAVRSTGASNVLMLAGLQWANDLTGWLANEPADPDHDLAASWHSYNFNACGTPACWSSQIAPVIARVPVITSEIGENDCGDSYISPLMTWLDSEHTSYLAWAWNTDFNCASGPGLITSYDGTPTAYGAGFETHISALAAG